MFSTTCTYEDVRVWVVEWESERGREYVIQWKSVWLRQWLTDWLTDWPSGRVNSEWVGVQVSVSKQTSK